MTDSQVHISDYTSLVRLKEALGGCGDSLLNLLHEVDTYLKGKMQQFGEQRDYLKEQLEIAERELREAEDWLSEAESDYSSCLASQREYEDEDGHTRISPSCSSERSCVESAKSNRDRCREKRDECQRKLDTAERIISDCKDEIDEYKFRYGILRPNGGECQLEYIADTHTMEAMQKLDEILDIVVREYLGRTVIEETSPNESLPSDKAQSFREASEKVKEKQQSESDSNKIAEADVSIRCTGCKRPMPICTCERGARERGHTNFQQPSRINPEIFGRINDEFNQRR